MVVTFGVVSLGPVVAGATLSEDEVVRAEDLTIGAASHRVHCAWLEVHQHCLNQEHTYIEHLDH